MLYEVITIPVLRDEYRIKQVTKVRADTLEELVKKLDGVDAGSCLREIQEYNKAVRTDVPFNMAVKDGRCTQGRITSYNVCYTKLLRRKAFETSFRRLR